MRYFEKVSRVKDIDIKLPERSTTYSAGYDFYAIENIMLEPNKTTLIKTGIKAYMEKDEFLMLCIRSSLAYKNNLSLSNGVGIVDHDYYQNLDNEGEIGFLIRNNSDSISFAFNKGDKIGQGIFMKYLPVQNDDSNRIIRVRTGGFGSTGR